MEEIRQACSLYGVRLSPPHMCRRHPVLQASHYDDACMMIVGMISHCAMLASMVPVIQVALHTCKSASLASAWLHFSI